MSEQTDRLKGRAKQATGDITGDDDLKQEGKTDESAADAKGKVDEATEKVKEKANEAKDKAQDAVDSIKDHLKK